MHNRDKPSSQPRKSSNHEQKHHSSKSIKEEQMGKPPKDSSSASISASAAAASMYANQMKYGQPYDTVNSKSVTQSQKHHQKSHHDKSHMNLQNNLSLSPHMVQNPNAMNPIQSNSLINANNLNSNMMQAAKANPLDQQQQHHIQNAHHQADLSVNPIANVQQQQRMQKAMTPPLHQTELKQHTSPAADIPMGVYTPDSATNSVHHHYGQCDIDVTQLGLESPASIASDIQSQNSVENVRPPSVVPHPQMNQFSDCSIQQQQANQAHIHMAIQHHQQQQQSNAARGYPVGPNEMVALNNQQQKQQQQQMQVAQQVRATNNRSTTPKAKNPPTPGLQQQHTTQRAQRTATPNTVQQQMVSPSQQIQQLNMQQQQHLHQQAQQVCLFSFSFYFVSY